jgi:hypothetical protein
LLINLKGGVKTLRKELRDKMSKKNIKLSTISCATMCKFLEHIVFTDASDDMPVIKEACTELYDAILEALGYSEELFDVDKNINKEELEELDGKIEELEEMFGINPKEELNK